MVLLKESGLDKLTPLELEKVIKQLQDLLNTKHSSTATHGQVIEIKSKPACPHCGGKHIVKNGHDHGVQRYICKRMRKVFCRKYKYSLLFYKIKL